MLQPDAGLQDRVEELFFAAIDLPQADRAIFLDRECAHNSELHSKVIKLLESDERAGRSALWRGSAMEVEARSEAVDEVELRIGQRLGSYRILRRLGAGGMGVVYEAVRDDKEFEKRVAIKLIQRDVASPRGLERLRHERQILANLDHPFIARLYDGGTGPEGFPFLVMELVEGQPLDQFVRGLPRDVRLKLYLQICSAAAYAHRNRIVHRDLKPGNILVTSEGTPKLLDFGIAQLLDSAGTSSEPGMTAGYSSPEQKEGALASVASDVFSLGVVLRELIPPEWQDADIIAIIAKAVRENSRERYESVDLLADDVARFLEGRTVLARKQHFVYRSRRFVSRHKVAVGIAAGFLILAAASSIALSRSASAARRERAVTERLANTGKFQPGGPLAYTAGMTAVRKSVDELSVDSLEKLLEETPNDPTIQRDLATAYQRLALVQGTVFSANVGNRGTARATMEKALYLRERLFDADSGNVIARGAFVETLAYLGRMAISEGEPDEAYRVHIRAWNGSKPLIDRGQLDEPFHIAAKAEYLLGIDLGGIGYSPHLGDPSGALIFHQDALRLTELWASAKGGDRNTATELALREELIAIDLTRLWRYTEAESHIERARTLLPREQPGIVTSGDSRTWCSVRSCYAWILTEEGKGREAVRLAREAQKGAAKLVDADSANVRARLDLSIADGVSGRALFLTGNTRAGIELLNRAIAEGEKLLQADPWHAELRGALMRHYLWAGTSAISTRQWADAKNRYQQADQLAARTVGAHPSDANARENLALAYLGSAQVAAHFGKAAEAAEFNRQAATQADTILAVHPENPSVRAILNAAHTLDAVR